ncbi:MAG: peptidoglycan-binding protein [Planctomycetes bacterium]|nr:peptidoglycan-binding protein [Planctomycetota bacterium]
MPWQCSECGADVATDVQTVCPGCGLPKTSWTVGDVTRTLRVPAGRRFEVLRGVEAGAVALDEATWAPTEVARAVPRARAAGLAAAGRLPSPKDVLVVRVTARGARDVTVTVLPEARAARDVVVLAPAGGERVDVRVLPVFGDGPDVALPGLALLDVSDATDDGFAPRLEVAAVGKPAREVRLEAAPRRVAWVELEDALFRTESAVLMPEGHDPEGAGAEPDRPPAGVGALAALLRHTDERPGVSHLVAGHTDTTGAASYNLPLSQQRADCAHAALTGDREAFARVAHARNVVADRQQALAWVARTRGYPCDPGPVDGIAGPRTQAAVRAFQQAYDDDAPVERLQVDGLLGPRTWAALLDCYERGLMEALGEDAAGLAALRAKLAFVDPARPAVGCGEHHPVEAPGVDGHRSQANRRVELLVFDPGEAPALACHAGGACAPAACQLYAPGRYERERLPVMLSARRWTATWEGAARFEEAARLVVLAPGLPAGVPMTFEVEQVGHGVVATLEATSTEGRVEASFADWFQPDAVAPPVDLEAPATFSPVSFAYTLRGAGRAVRSPPLVYADRLNALLLSRGEEQPLVRRRYTLRSPWGALRGETDDEGVAVVEGLPPGGVHVLVDDELAREGA